VWRSRTGPPPARKWEAEVRLETDAPYMNPPVDAYGTPYPAAGAAPPPAGEPSVPGGAPYIPPIPEAYRQATSGGAGSAGPGAPHGTGAAGFASGAAGIASGAAGIASGAERVRERIRSRKRSRWGCTPDWRSAPPPPPGREAFGPENAGQGTEHAFGAFRSHPHTGRGQRPTLFAMMSGVRRQVTGGFAGAEATAIMGGVELDLRYSAMDGDEVIIDTFALWGGIEIWVPTHWEIVSQGLPLMGAFEDKTHVTTHGGNRQPRLVVRGVAIMGGVEIKN
jgi:hypothetical protein